MCNSAAYAFASNLAYNSGPELREGSKVTSSEGISMTVIKSWSTPSGYKGVVLRDNRDDCVIVANAGTEPLPGRGNGPQDLLTDIAMAVGALAPQLPDAFAAYEWAMNYANNNGLRKPTVTGHSLGGALSQLQDCK